MPKYETRVTLPADLAEFLAPFMLEGEVTFDFDMIDTRGESSFIFTFDAADMWDAHSTVSAAADAADSGRGIRRGATSFTKAEEVSPLRLPDIDVDNLPTAPRTERVYMTAEAAAAASLDSDDENLREHNERNRERLAEKPWVSEENGERLTAEEANTQRARYEPDLPVRRNDGATLSVGSDRYPYTITDVVLYKSGGKQGKPRYVRATLDDAAVGSDDIERYVTRHDREPEEFLATSQPGVFRSAKGTLRVGKRSHYLAPEF